MTTVKLLAVTLVAPLALLVTKPPKAWVVTSSGRHQLGYSTFCWTRGGESLCADHAAPTCKRTPGEAPKILIRRGERIRFELGFAPRTVTVAVGRGPARKLVPTRHPTWRATRAGPLVLFADAKTNGDASYVACIVFRR
jgi:hypothetical protein